MKRLKKVSPERLAEMHTFKSENLITPAHMEVYGKSQHVSYLQKLLVFLKLEEIAVVNKVDAVDIGNYLMVMTSIMIATRVSNLINRTINDFKNAKTYLDFPEAMVIR